MVKRIKNKTDYENSFRRLGGLMSEAENYDRIISVLATEIERYEKEIWPIDFPNPVDAIKFRMDQQNLHQCDVAHLFGSKSRASEVLGGKRPLTLKMIRALYGELKVPLECLIGQHKK